MEISVYFAILSDDTNIHVICGFNAMKQNCKCIIIENDKCVKKRNKDAKIGNTIPIEKDIIIEDENNLTEISVMEKKINTNAVFCKKNSTKKKVALYLTCISLLKRYTIIDYSTFNSRQLLYSGSGDNTIRVYDNFHNIIICSSSEDKTIRF
ncbi:hypothetical protein RFI_03854 [Reticulomyxa filosa]|uniref:Uncharacterized protein n=1 Tax=Reticulomyxa filosa TaxID=46433 RepID=X6P3X5_RETFI|nr:hypothetical protein RFI_03854 [Reticulomyxa filosa]|eukprot:ETO33255.1 hypothetical protein RFI_03854 [Reticulomyxa filosa]